MLKDHILWLGIQIVSQFLYLRRNGIQHCEYHIVLRPCKWGVKETVSRDGLPVSFFHESNCLNNNFAIDYKKLERQNIILRGSIADPKPLWTDPDPKPFWTYPDPKPLWTDPDPTCSPGPFKLFNMYYFLNSPYWCLNFQRRLLVSSSRTVLRF